MPERASDTPDSSVSPFPTAVHAVLDMHETASATGSSRAALSPARRVPPLEQCRQPTSAGNPALHHILERVLLPHDKAAV